MYFNKSETYYLKHLSLYRNTAILTMVMGILGLLLGAYVIFFKEHTGRDYALTAAAIVFISCGLMMFRCIEIIEKFKQAYKLDGKDKVA